MRAFIENSSNRPKGFLPCSVPNLQLYQCIIVDHHCIVAKFDTDRHIVLLVALALGQSSQNTGFADASVPNDDQLEQGSVVILLIVFLVVICFLGGSLGGHILEFSLDPIIDHYHNYFIFQN